MRRLGIITLLSISLLAACSSGTHSNETDQANQNTTEETGDTSESAGQSNLSEEERNELELIQSLPEESDTDDWNLILVNNENPLPEDFNVETTEVADGESIDSRIVENWEQWDEKALENSFSLSLISGYRTVDHQESNFNSQLQAYISEGDSEEEAYEKTARYYAIPGESEHHTGLAVDILDTDWMAQGRSLEEEYETQESQHFLEDTMTEFGFILRYPEDKEEITGIGYEPWHFRYVGRENAEFMVGNNLALEEYIELLNKRDELAAQEDEESTNA